jgi:hypothetical protein
MKDDPHLTTVSRIDDTWSIKYKNRRLKSEATPRTNQPNVTIR